MKPRTFWNTIDQARGNALRADAASLERQLEGLSKSELEGFQAAFDRLFDRANRWLLWGAAYLIGGGCSDDGFTDFRYGLISFGEKVFEKAIADPDTLADVGPAEDIWDEGFGYVAGQVYEARFGSEVPRIEPLDADMGDDWDFEDEDAARNTFPRLYKRFGG